MPSLPKTQRIVVPPPAPAPAEPAPAAPQRLDTARPGNGGRVKASPLARKIAAQSGVDLKLVQGSGPGGRIVRRDVESAVPFQSRKHQRHQPH